MSPGERVGFDRWIMHQAMIGDTRRLTLYDRALQHAISPGDIVVDVGAGMLILSLLALKHGAARVYAVEGNSQLAELARCIARQNDVQSQLTVIEGDARSVAFSEPADVIISEMMGNFGPEEDMPALLRAVAQRCLRKGGRVVPARLSFHVQAIEFEDEGWGIWHNQFWGFDLSVVQDFAPNTSQLHFFRHAPKLLSESVCLAQVALGQEDADPCGTWNVKIIESGRLHAFVGYFVADLSDGLRLTNFPSYPGSNWAVWVWPVRHTRVRPGDHLQVDIDYCKDARFARNWCMNCKIARRETQP
jgi:protein arginine N-methyltransferase 1